MAEKKQKPLADVPPMSVGSQSPMPSEEGELTIPEARSLELSQAPAMPLTPHNPNPDGRRRLSASMKLATMEDRIKAFNAVTTQDQKAQDHLQEEIVVQDWLCHDASKTDPKTGEVKSFVRTVLIGPDGFRTSTTSDMVLQSILSLMHFFGPAPWNPPLKLRVKPEKATSNPGHYYTLEVIP